MEVIRAKRAGACYGVQRALDMADEVIADATGYAETDNSEILEARQMFADKLRQHKEEISGEADRVRQAGGLFIIGTERHDSRRIDNQLRGRAGRQGDPGETRFYISLEDDLMRLFGGERVQAAMERMNIDEDMPIESKMLTRSIQQAQTTVESRNFQARKSVLEYDDVMNKQREIIYGQRRQVLEGMDVKDVIMNMMNTSITHLVQNAFSGVQHLDMTSCQELLRQVEGVYFPKYAVRFSQEQLDAMEVLLKKMDQAEDDASFAEMDIAFHGMIVDAADSPSLKRAWDNLRLVEWTSVSVAVTQESLPELAEQHWQIFRTLRSHAEQEAGAYMFLHIKHFGEELKRYVTETEQAEAVPQEREERRLS